MVPALDKLKLMTSTQLAKMRPVHVVYTVYSSYIDCLGFGMSDGQSAQTGECGIKAELPNNIKTIEVSFIKKENAIHSISFQGDSILTIGGADKKNTYDDLRKGRTKKFTLLQG